LSTKQIRIYVSYVSVTYLILHKELKEAKHESSAICDSHVYAAVLILDYVQLFIGSSFPSAVQILSKFCNDYISFRLLTAK